MKYIIIITAIFVFCFLHFNHLNAQTIDSTQKSITTNDSAKLVIITLNDNSVMKGYILKMDLEEIQLKTEFAGVITIKQSNIKRTEYYNNTKSTQTYSDKNPNDLHIIKFSSTNKKNYITFKSNHKYYLNNNYFGLKKNELVYQNIWILYNGFDYGLTDNFSVGGGFMFVGVNLHLRTQFELNEKVKVGAAYNLFIFPRNSSYVKFGLLTTGFTVGNKKYNATLSMGKGDISSTDPYYSPPNNYNNLAYAFSGAVCLNEMVSIITDNFFMANNDEKFFSLGLRFHDKNMVFDLGLMANTYQETVYNYDYSSTTGSYTTSTQESSIAYPFLALCYKIK